MKGFNPREVLEVAIEMERQGEAFYRELFKAAKSEEAGNLLLRMAKEENTHAEDFKKLLDSLTRSVSEYAYPVDEQSALYFEAFAKTQVFKDIDSASKSAAGFESFEDAVNYAIGLEIKTIAFYRELLAAMRGVEGAEVIEQLIDQERGHVAGLYRLL